MAWILAVDAGNTVTRLAAVSDGEVAALARLPSADDDPQGLATALGRLQALQGEPPVAAGISCVVPDRLAALRAAVGEQAPVTEVGPETAAGLRIAYAPAESLGPDRIANAVAARDRLGIPCIAVDLGTALTVEVVDAAGVLRGGALFPGMAAAAEALGRAAARLSLAPHTERASAIGASTAAGIAAGLDYGYPALITGLLEGVRRELGTEAPAVLTGGGARRLAGTPAGIQLRDPHLTLRGVAAIALVESGEKARHPEA